MSNRTDIRRMQRENAKNSDREASQKLGLSKAIRAHAKRYGKTPQDIAQEYAKHRGAGRLDRTHFAPAMATS